MIYNNVEKKHIYHLTPPYSDLACGGPGDNWFIIIRGTNRNLCTWCVRTEKHMEAGAEQEGTETHTRGLRINPKL